MSRPLTLPTIYSVIDKVTAPLAKMGNAAAKFGEKAEASLSRLDRKFRPLKRDAAITGAAIVAPLALAVNEARKYEDALASFHTIVSDKSEKEFKQYENSIKKLGDKTSSTYEDVAASYEKIAGLNETFARTPEAISAVTEATITLARASRQDLGTSAENLVGIMNQFDLQANQASRTINVLAAGQAVGAATIAQSAEAYKNFGSTAKAANITLEQSQALIQTVGKFMILGAEAGTKLRGSVSKLQDAGFGYASGQFQINDALEEARKKYDRLSSAQKKDAFITKTFGLENKNVGLILLNNIGLYKDFTTAVTGTNEAQKAAEINQKTLSARYEKMKAQVKNLAVTVGENLLPPLSQLAEQLIPIVQKFSKWAKDNPKTLSTIIKISLAIAGASFAIAAISQVLTIATKVMAAYNFIVGIGSTVVKAWRSASLFAAQAQGVLNAVMNLNPVFLIITGVTLLTAGLYLLSRASSNLTAAERVANEVRDRALETTMDQRVEVQTLFAALRKTTVGSEDYQYVLEKIEAIQPGITKQYNLQAGALRDINQAEKDLTDSIMKRAMVEARMDLLKEKSREYLKQQNEGVGFTDYVKGLFTAGPMAAQFGAMDSYTSRLATINDEIKVLSDQVANDQLPTPAVTSQGVAQANAFETMLGKGFLNININDPGNNATVESQSKTPMFMIQTNNSKIVP